MYKGTIAMQRSTLGYVLSRSKVPIEGEPGNAPSINWVSKHGDFRRRSKRWFLLVLLVAAAAGSAFPAKAQVELDILNLFKEAVQKEGPQSDPASTRGKRNLDVGAVALVEEIRDSPGAGVQFMDYVYPKQVLRLGRNGRVVLSYLDGCLVETISGGTVTMTPSGSRVAGGKVKRLGKACPDSAAVVGPDASEAGATVNRISPFLGMDWSERVIGVRHPIFKWTGQKGTTRIRILAMDHIIPRIIWASQSRSDFASYPAEATPLKMGLPYRVEVLLADGTQLGALFSVDEGLQVSNTLANRVVALRR